MTEEGRIDLSALLGNTFCASGVLGLIKGASLLDTFDRINIVNEDGYGRYVSIVITGEKDEQ